MHTGGTEMYTAMPQINLNSLVISCTPTDRRLDKGVGMYLYNEKDPIRAHVSIATANTDNVRCKTQTTRG